MRHFQAVLIALVLTVGQASAALLEADLFLAGDGLITQDTQTGLEWLDITMTLNLSYTDITAGHEGLATAHRFRYATRAEVRTLFANAGIPNIDDGWVLGNGPPIHELQGLIGKTDFMHSAGLIHQTQGITGDTDGEDHYGALLEFWTVAGSGNADTTWSKFSTDERHENVGSWLVREPAIPFSGFYPTITRVHFGGESQTDGFFFAGSLVLSGSSDGIDLIQEEVAVHAGPLIITIPSGSFRGRGPAYIWDGDVDDARAKVVFKDLGDGFHTFSIRADGLDLSGWSNPDEWGLRIGNDEGTVTKWLKGQMQE